MPRFPALQKASSSFPSPEGEGQGEGDFSYSPATIEIRSAPGQPAIATKLRAGFTLMELLIVIALISILSLAAIIGYRLQLAKGFDAVRKQDINALKISFEHYYSDHLCYPTSEILTDCGGAELQPYLNKIPCDPETQEPYTLVIDTPVCAQRFFLFTELTNTKDPDILCNDRYGAASGNASVAEIEARCRGQYFCTNGYYGCIQGQCTLVSAVTKPACAPLFCVTNCQNSCALPGWELYPQPCY